MEIIEYIPLAVIGVCAICGSISDIRQFKVYNALTFPCFIAGILFHAVAQGWGGLGYSLGGSALGLAVLILPYILGGIGAGDVKFVMAIGTWLGPTLLLPSILIGSIATGIYSFILIAQQGGFRETWLNIQLMFLRLAAIAKSLQFEDDFESVQKVCRKPDRGKRLIPFSALFSLGIVITFAVNWLIGGLILFVH